MIIHQVTGRSWAREVGDRLIRPLGLRDTSTPGSFPFILGPHAQAYAAFGTDTGTDVTALNSTMAVGGGSIISTTHDLNRFYAALLGSRLPAPAQLDEMTTTEPAPELGVNYGLGLAEIPLSCGGSYFGHRGELLGYVTWAGATRHGTRTAVVYGTSDGSRDTQQAMTTLLDQQLCRPSSWGPSSNDPLPPLSHRWCLHPGPAADPGGPAGRVGTPVSCHLSPRTSAGHPLRRRQDRQTPGDSQGHRQTWQVLVDANKLIEGG